MDTVDRSRPKRERHGFQRETNSGKKLTNEKAKIVAACVWLVMAPPSTSQRSQGLLRFFAWLPSSLRYKGRELYRKLVRGFQPVCVSEDQGEKRHLTEPNCSTLQLGLWVLQASCCRKLLAAPSTAVDMDARPGILRIKLRIARFHTLVSGTRSGWSTILRLERHPA